MTKIKEHFLVKNGYAFKSDTFIKSGVPLIKIKNISDNTIDLSLTTDFLPEKYITEYSEFLVKPNDILIALSGATLGKFAFYEDSQTSLLNQRVALIRPLSKTSSIKYLYYYLFQIIDSIKNKERGGAQGNISTLDIENTEIFLPPLAIQNKIVTTLDKIQILINKRKETLSVLDEFTKSSFLELFGDPVTNSKNWKTEKLENLVTKDCTLSYGVLKADEVEDGVPIVRPVDLNIVGELNILNLKKIDKSISDKYKRSILKGNELLLCVRGNVGNIKEINSSLKDCNVSRGIVPIRLSNIISREFLLTLIRTKSMQNKLKSLSRGIALQQLNISVLREIQIIVPNINLKKFSNIYENISNHKEKLEGSLYDLNNLLNSFLQIAFTKKSIKEKSELDKYLVDLFLQQELFGKIKTQDFQLKEEYDSAKEILFELLESGESIISQTREKDKIQIQIS